MAEVVRAPAEALGHGVPLPAHQRSVVGGVGHAEHFRRALRPADAGAPRLRALPDARRAALQAPDASAPVLDVGARRVAGGRDEPAALAALPPTGPRVQKLVPAPDAAAAFGNGCGSVRDVLHSPACFALLNPQALIIRDVRPPALWNSLFRATHRGCLELARCRARPFSLRGSSIPVHIRRAEDLARAVWGADHAPIAILRADL
mmetsp:Transcript_27167/g.78006  ORF Transcript_27167/g.78006 Transcript_27167/m.78006 type:complete len:205 (+) Transcript_27167:3057-3671(+)